MIDDFKRPAARPSSNDDHSTLPKPTLQHSAGVHEPAFMSPERIAARDNMLAKAGLAGASGGAGGGGSVNGKSFKPSKSGRGRTITLFRRWTVSRKKFIIVTSLLVLLIGGGAAGYVLTRPDTPVAKKPVKQAQKEPEKPAPILSPLTGLPVTAEQKTRPVVGVMIENSGDARPQSGLKDAGVVYEAIAEAGITRFLALFQEQDTPNLGPVRSSRPYYLDWAMAFDAAYAHVGGSPDALQRIKAIGVKDMDQFFNPSAYHRITSRYAPHNVYTDVPTLRNLSISKGWTASTYTSFERKAEQPYKAPAEGKPATDKRPVANGINLGISGAFYNVHYDYDAATNTYKRTLGGAPHIDADSNTQIQPKVVIALVMAYSLMADGYHSQYNTQGSNKMYVFQDGTVTTGTWSKGEPKEQFVFKDDAGAVIKLNPGQTWISVVADPAKVTYQ